MTQLPNWQKPFTASAILDVIAATAVLFDALAGQWSEEYEGRKRPLLTWVQSLIGDYY